MKNKNKCELCNNNEYQMALGLFGYIISNSEKIINHNIFICYSCATAMISCMIKLTKNRLNTNFIIPSLPWARRQRMGKITKDEMIDINLWIEKLKNIKDFKEE